MEKNLNLALAVRLREELKKAGLEAVLSREADVDVPLKQRLELARRAGVAAFVSLHHNSASSALASGAETYYQARRPESRRLAGLLQSSLVEATGLTDRGIKTRLREDGQDYYYILREASLPAVICEVAFLTNPSDAQRLAASAFQDEAARALAAALVRFVTPAAPGPFPDVPADHWAAAAVAWAVHRGILQGYPDGRFHGPEPATRYELAGALYRLYSSQHLTDDQHQGKAGEKPEG
ncbi:MAG TPA: N-acetylmuramoyl-L-alanine amidase [Firmicutes bacterium]|nr:N-acetylmuramoyl-L-alanine amidase [Bacillota bacterium]